MHPEPAATAPDSDWLDALLVADAVETRAAHIDDAGFTARVMARLPQQLTLPAWRRRAVQALWGLAAVGAVVALPQSALEVTREAYRLLAAHPISLSGIGGAMFAAVALLWGATAWTWRAQD